MQFWRRDKGRAVIGRILTIKSVFIYLFIYLSNVSYYALLGNNGERVKVSNKFELKRYRDKIQYRYSDIIWHTQKRSKISWDIKLKKHRTRKRLLTDTSAVYAETKQCIYLIHRGNEAWQTASVTVESLYRWLLSVMLSNSSDRWYQVGKIYLLDCTSFSRSLDQKNKGKRSWRIKITEAIPMLIVYTTIHFYILLCIFLSRSDCSDAENV